MKQTMREVVAIAIFLLALISAPVSQSLAPPSFRRRYCSRTSKDARTITSFLQMSSSEENTSPSRRRRKRKDGKNSNLMDEDQENLESVQYEERRAVKLEPVQLKVQDVRNLASGNLEEIQTESKFKEEIQQQDSRKNNKVSVGTSSSNDSSLEALLADAKRMRENEASKSVESEEPSIPNAIKSVISTIVTVDFFVVCALLVWFLAGIFCSYVLKDDAVQIAFNGIFQPVVQPALGILMIGSAAGAAFGDPKKE